jgi:hypothetical protein
MGLDHSCILEPIEIEVGEELELAGAGQQRYA